MPTRSRQLVTSEQAVNTKRQHTSPCSDCPFSRKALPGWLGLTSAGEWLQAAHGEGTAECHTTIDRHCAGFAIYRANVAKKPRDPKAFVLEPNREKVFATPGEFLNHHKGAENELQDPQRQEARLSDVSRDRARPQGWQQANAKPLARGT